MNGIVQVLLKWCVGGLVSLSITAAVRAGEPPEIANIFPDYPGITSQIITGERFDPALTEVWRWEPPSGERVVREAAARLGEALPALPAQPPERATRVNVLDADGKVQRSRPFSTEAWNKTASQSWLQWARE